MTDIYADEAKYEYISPNPGRANNRGNHYFHVKKAGEQTRKSVPVNNFQSTLPLIFFIYFLVNNELQYFNNMSVDDFLKVSKQISV